MKSQALHLAIGLFVLLSFSLKGQTLIEQVNQRADAVWFHSVIANPNGDWIFSGNSNPYGGVSSPSHFIQSVSSSGIVNWDFAHTNLSYNEHSTSPIKGDQITILPDSGVFMVGILDPCDVPVSKSHIYRLDALGILEWDFILSLPNGSTYQILFDRLATNPISNLAIASNDSVMILNENGDFLNKWKSTTTPIHCLRWDSDTTILIAAGTELLRVHSNGDLLESVNLPSSNIGLDIHSNANEILVLTEDSIHRFTNGFQSDGDIDISAISSPYIDFVEGENEIWITNGSSLWSVTPQNTLNLLVSLNQTYPSIAYNNNLVMTASVAGSHRAAGLMKSFLMDGTSVTHEDDIELLVQIDSTGSVIISPPGDPLTIYAHYIYVTPRIVNHSQQPLDKVLLSYRIDNAPSFCAGDMAGLTVIEEGMNLSPGDTSTAFFLPLNVGFVGPAYGQSTLQASVAMAAVSPNDHIDINPLDNIWSKDTVMSIPSGIEDIHIDKTLNIYPNPTNGIINLPEVDNLKWELIDLVGRTVIEGNNETQIDLRAFDLAAQTYFLRFNTNDVQATVKLVYWRQ